MAKGEVVAPESKVLDERTEPHEVKLKQDELLDRGSQLARTLTDIQSETSRAESVKIALKSAMSALEARRDELSSVVSRGCEIREVLVQAVANYRLRTVEYVRQDTGEIVRSRSMTADELQTKIELVQR
jgi:hypothetical protein